LLSNSIIFNNVLYKDLNISTLYSIPKMFIPKNNNYLNLYIYIFIYIKINLFTSLFSNSSFKIIFFFYLIKIFILIFYLIILKLFFIKEDKLIEL
jgi:hypothetical protein